MSERKLKPSVEEIIETLHAAKDICLRYEKKYNILSEQFYELSSQGLLDDDGLNFDFVDWAGSYKTVHKHIHPDIKHHRIPAPGLSFIEPTLPFLIREIETLFFTEISQRDA